MNILIIKKNPLKTIKSLFFVFVFQAEDDSSKLTKSELNSSKPDVDSPSSTSPEPQGDAGSDPSASLENPLYSTTD